METKLSDLKTGQFFTIGNTPSYPKLRTAYGYVDFRDLIKKECSEISFPLRVMTDEEVLEQVKKYGIDTIEILNEERNKLL